MDVECLLLRAAQLAGELIPLHYLQPFLLPTWVFEFFGVGAHGVYAESPLAGLDLKEAAQSPGATPAIRPNPNPRADCLCNLTEHSQGAFQTPAADSSSTEPLHHAWAGVKGSDRTLAGKRPYRLRCSVLATLFRYVLFP